MRILLRRLDVAVAEHGSDQGQGQAACRAEACESVSQIMQADLGRACSRANPLPDLRCADVVALGVTLGGEDVSGDLGPGERL